MNELDKKQVVKHLKKASDEIQTALGIMYGHFAKYYRGLYSGWKIINKAIDFFSK